MPAPPRLPTSHRAARAGSASASPLAGAARRPRARLSAAWRKVFACALSGLLLSVAATGQQEQLRLAESLFERGLYDLAVEAYNQFLQREPDSEQAPLATYRLAESYRLSGNPPMALRLYRLLDTPPAGTAAPPGPYAHLARLRLGEHHLMQGEFAPACQILKRVAPDVLPAPARPAYALYLGRSAYEAGEPGPAREAFELLLKAPGAPRASVLQGRFFLAVMDQADGHAEAALRQFRDLASEPDLGEPFKEQVHSRVARLLYNLDRHAEAADEARLFARLYPDSTQAAEIYKAGIWAELRAERPQRVIEELGEQQATLQDPELLYCLASAYRLTGQDAPAGTLYDRLAESAATPASLRRKAAYEALLMTARGGSPNELIRRANAFARDYPGASELADVYLLAARTYRTAGQLETARKTFQAILELDGVPPAISEQATYQAAECQKELQHYEPAAEAFAAFARAFPASPLLPRARLGQAACLLAGGRAADAEALLDAHISLLEKDPELAGELAYQRALARAAAGDRAGMARRLEELLERAPEAARAGEASYLLGLYHFEREDLERAIERLSAAVQHPLPPAIAAQARLRLAMAWQQKGDPNEAVRLFLENVRQGGGGEIPDQLLLWVGHHCLEQLRFDEALESFRPLFERAAQPAMKQGAALGLAYAEIGMAQYDLARGHLVQAVEIEARNQPGVEGNLALGDLYLRQLDQADAAAACYRSALEAAASEWPRLAARARLGLGRAALAAGNPAEAARQYLAVAVLYDDPELTPQALLDAGKAFLQAGDEPHAREAFGELRERFPDSAQARSLSAAPDPPNVVRP